MIDKQRLIVFKDRLSRKKSGIAAISETTVSLQHIYSTKGKQTRFDTIILDSNTVLPVKR